MISIMALVLVYPAVIIEAKITGDDGTARDKVTRIEKLAAMRDERIRQGVPGFEVVAGRGVLVHFPPSRTTTRKRMLSAICTRAPISRADVKFYCTKTRHIPFTGRCSVDIKSHNVVYPTVWYS
jgi:hypothetical protein